MSERRASQDAGDEFGFLDNARRTEPRAAGADPAASLPSRRRRRREKTGKRSNPDYVQVSAWVRKRVRADFDVAQAEEAAESGRRREFSEVIESLMSFYAQEGDPWQLTQGQRR